MAEIKTEAFILRSIPFKETSKIVRLYTRDQGKIAAIARGASRPKSDFRGLLDPLNYMEVIIYFKESREVQTLGEVELIKSFMQNSQDIDGLYYASAVLEALDKFIDGTEDNQLVFQLTKEVLTEIDSHESMAQALLVYYLLQLSGIMGYSINLDKCSLCGKGLESAYYNTGVDHLICEECSHSDDLPIPSEQLDFFRKAINSKPDGIDLEEYAGINFSQSGKFLLKYLGWHMEVSPVLKSLKTLSSLRM